MNLSKKIFIVGPAWIGDMVMAGALFKFIKQRSPNVVIDVLASPSLKTLLSRMPFVDRVLESSLAHKRLDLGARFKLGRSLRSLHYDQAIVLPNSFKSALIPFWAKIPRRTGWRGEMRYGLLNDLRILDKKKYPLMVERFLMLGLPKDNDLSKDWPYPELKTNDSNIKATLQALGIKFKRQPILALCPGAEYGSSKRWPAEYFAEIAKEKIISGWQVVILGGAADKNAAEIIQKSTSLGCIDLAGKTDLAQAVDILLLADYVITNDSGLMHVAAALQRPLLAIYGSSSPNFTPPLGKAAKILSLNLPCSPCFKRECPLGHLNCLRSITPKMILQNACDK